MKQEIKFASFFLFLFSNLFFVSALTQTEYCTAINPNMSLFDCDTVWSAINPEQIIINNTIIENHTKVINTTINNTFVNETLFSFSDIENNISELVQSKINEFQETTVLSVDDRIKLMEAEFRINQLRQNTSQPKEECDIMCQMRKNLDAQIEMQMLRNNYCILDNSFDFCQTNSKPNEEINESELTILRSELGNLRSQISNSNQPQPQPQNNNNNSLYLLIGVLVLLAGGYFYYNKQKTDSITRTQERDQINQNPQSFPRIKEDVEYPEEYSHDDKTN